MEDPFTQLIQGLTVHGQRNAFHIDGHFFSYAELSTKVEAIRSGIRQGPPDRVIGVMAHDDLLTYASLLALWAEGRAFVPLSPGSPQVRNDDVIEQAGIGFVLNSSLTGAATHARMVRTDLLPEVEGTAPLPEVAGTETAYLLFTSGTTGRPKGVPISRNAVAAFVEAFDALGLAVGPEDRCLQMFELTFDLSVMSYLIPLLKGACVYTIPKDAIKYAYIHELMEDQQLTVALMVPSILNFLRPYFDEVYCPALRASLFCGEALPLDVVQEWSLRVPNARIINAYGPTEHTIFCTEYEYHRLGTNKQRNGILSIGKPMFSTTVTIVDEQHNALPTGEEGELCLGGPQGTEGYWNDPERNATSFIHPKGLTDGRRYYRTGDRCLMDADGDLIYLGRVDQQVKVQGFRVELGELEHHAKGLLERQNVVAAAMDNAQGNTELILVTEGAAPDAQGLVKKLRTVLPPYMVPTRVHHMESLPLNVNGKIDRPAVARWLRSLTK